MVKRKISRKRKNPDVNLYNKLDNLLDKNSVRLHSRYFTISGLLKANWKENSFFISLTKGDFDAEATFNFEDVKDIKGATIYLKDIIDK